MVWAYTTERASTGMMLVLIFDYRTNKLVLCDTSLIFLIDLAQQRFLLRLILAIFLTYTSIGRFSGIMSRLIK